MAEQSSFQNSIIYLDGVTVDYDGFKALNNLTFMVDYKELRVVIGPNGAGKTTLLDVICGKTKPASGRVVFGRDVDLKGKHEDEIVALGIGRKFQAPSVYGFLSVWLPPPFRYSQQRCRSPASPPSWSTMHPQR